MAPSTRHQATPTPDDDLDWCHDAVQDVSRTFAITIDVLDEPMASQICVGYLLCRIPDTVEDAGHIPPADQAALLETYAAVLDEDDPTDVDEFLAGVEPWIPDEADRSADWRVVAETPRVLNAYWAQPASVRDAVRPPARELVSGMATFVERYADVGGLRIENRDELRSYCHYAAGTVGHLITNLVCRNDVGESTERRLYDTAESFGLLLQLVNVAKDVHADYHEENNVYLPASLLEKHGVPQDSLTADGHRDGTAATIREVVDLARSYMDDAQTYLETVPEVAGNRLAAWAIPYLLAVGTLRELSERPADALSEGGVKITREEVQAVIGATLSGADSEDLPEFRRAIEQRPFHEV